VDLLIRFTPYICVFMQSIGYITAQAENRAKAPEQNPYK